MTEHRNPDPSANRDRLQLEAIFNNATVALFIMDEQQVCTYLNPAAEALTGYCLAEVTGRPLHDVVHHTRPDGSPYPIDECPIDRAFPERSRMQGEETFVHKDGRFYPVAFTASPIRYGEIRVGTVIEVRDISEQKRHEAEIRRQAGQHQRLAQIALAVAAAPNLESTLSVLTEAARTIIGAHQSVVSLTRGPDWSQSINAVSLSDKYERWRDYVRAPNGSGIYALVCEQNHPIRLTQAELESHPRWRNFGSSRAEHPPMRGWLAVPMIGRDGRNLGLIQLSDKEQGDFDDSDQAILVQLARYSAEAIEQSEAEVSLRESEARLRESEQRFRLMADSIDQMIWVTQPDGYHEYYNQRWYDYTGVPAGSTDGEGWNGMFHPEDQARAWELWRHSLATGEPYEIEYRLRHISGEYRWVLGRALPMRDEQGRILKWFGTCTDIDGQKRANEERERLLNAAEQARAEAEMANRMKDEFLATLSHELRTPLNAILGWARLLRSGKIDGDDLAEGLEVIERNSSVQAQLIEDLLDISRIISGNLRLEVQRVDLIEVIEAALAAATPAADAKGIRLTKVLDSLAGPVSGDAARIQQIVWNLLSNAVKFTPKGGKVLLLLERVNSHVEISVIDSGIGIRPEFLPHVFERFRQADGSTTRRHGGLGLGLSIVRQLAEMHGGSVRAKSPGEGQGATFIVALPITVVHPEQIARPRPNDDEPSTFDCAEEPLAGIRVLVVDDEPDARALVERVLVDCQAEVAVAASADEALALLESFRPHVLVSDIGMPERDGYDLIRQVRARGFAAKDLPAAALTAFARSEDRRRALLAGFQTHVAKPVDPSELMAVVASLAGRTGI